MLITYLILKLTFQSILNECNKLALEEESKAQTRLLKSKLLKLNLDYEKGVINDNAFSKTQDEILKDLRKMTG